MTPRFFLLPLALLLGLALSAGPAQAAPSLEAVGAAQEPPLSDGDRWAAISTGLGVMEVLDGRGNGLTRRTVELEPPCGSPYSYPRGVGGGYVVIQCGYRPGEARPRLLVYDLAAQTFTEAAGTEVIYSSAEGVDVDGIGRSWINLGFRRHHGGSTPVLLEWRTGRTASPATLAADRVIDLDAAFGTRRLCTPIRRPRSARRLFAYRSPFAISDRGTALPRSLVLERCAGRSVTLASSSAAGVQHATLGRHAVAWVQGTAIRARSLRGTTQRRWRAPLGRRPFGVAQVGRHLLVTIQGGPHADPNGPSLTVYRGRLP